MIFSTISTKSSKKTVKWTLVCGSDALLQITLTNFIGILLPKLFGPTVRKNCSSDREKVLKLEAEGQEFAKFLRSLEQFIQTVKGQNNFR